MSAHQVAALSVAMLGLLILSFAVLLLPVAIGFAADFNGGGLHLSPGSVGLVASSAASLVLGTTLLSRRFRVASWLIQASSNAQNAREVPSGAVAIGILGLYFLVVGISGLLHGGVLLAISGSLEDAASMTSNVAEIGIGLALVLRGGFFLRLWQPASGPAA